MERGVGLWSVLPPTLVPGCRMCAPVVHVVASNVKRMCVCTCTGRGVECEAPRSSPAIGVVSSTSRRRRRGGHKRVDQLLAARVQVVVSNVKRPVQRLQSTWLAALHGVDGVVVTMGLMNCAIGLRMLQPLSGWYSAAFALLGAAVLG